MDGFEWYLALVLFGLLTGTLSGVLGVGGGIFMVPFLVLVGDFGQQSAQATSLMVILPTAIVATASLRKRGVGDVSEGFKIGLLGIVGSVLGATLALQLTGSTLRYLFAALLTVVGVRLLLDAWQLRRPEGGNEPT